MSIIIIINYTLVPENDQYYNQNERGEARKQNEKEMKSVEDMILSVNSLPEALHRRIRTDRVRVHEEGGIFTLTPVNDLRKESWEALEQLRDMLSDGRMSADGYSAQKRADKELER